jgi:hypothetical protein
MIFVRYLVAVFGFWALFGWFWSPWLGIAGLVGLGVWWLLRSSRRFGFRIEQADILRRLPPDLREQARAEFAQAREQDGRVRARLDESCLDCGHKRRDHGDGESTPERCLRAGCACVGPGRYEGGPGRYEPE